MRVVLGIFGTLSQQHTVHPLVSARLLERRRRVYVQNIWKPECVKKLHTG